MTIIFNDADLTSSYRQQRNILRVYIAVAVVFAAICAACLVYFISLPYEDPNQIIPKIIICVASCLFVIFSYVSNITVRESIINLFHTFPWE